MIIKHYRVRFYSFHKYRTGKISLLVLDEVDYDLIGREVDQQMSAKFSDFDIVSVEITRWELIEDDIKGDMYEVRAKVTVKAYSV